MRLSARFLRLAAVLAVVGGLFGAGVSMTKAVSLSPVQIYPSLIGWVPMFLYGLFYRVVPDAEWMALSRYQFATSVAGAALFLASLVIGSTDALAVETLASAGLVAGSMLILAGMILFSLIVFRSTGLNVR